MRYYTSDNHFCHAKIIEYCKRPFANVGEMNAEMVRRWNEIVTPEDEVYHLGDFAFGPVEAIGHFLAKLNGKVFIVLGNHDRKQQIMERYFGYGRVFKELMIRDCDMALYLSHKPNVRYKEVMGFVGNTPTEHVSADFHLHGHLHEKQKRLGDTINVGVDQWDFRPVTLTQLLAAPQDNPCTTAAQV